MSTASQHIVTLEWPAPPLLRVDRNGWVLEQAGLATHVRSAAKPAPTPELFVGVLTETKMRSASMIALSTSVLKKRLTPLCFFTISSRPGS